jgi:tyrosyl-tRNA synthetase
VVPADEIKEGKIWIVKALVLAKLVQSSGEARRLIKGGGVYVDGNKIASEEHGLSMPGEYIVKVGKRRFVRVKGS